MKLRLSPLRILPLLPFLPLVYLAGGVVGVWQRRASLRLYLGVYLGWYGQRLGALLLALGHGVRVGLAACWRHGKYVLVPLSVATFLLLLWTFCLFVTRVMVPFPSSLSSVAAPRPGEWWRLQSETHNSGPWSTALPPRVCEYIRDVRDGWVRSYMTRFSPDERLEIPRYVAIMRRASAEECHGSEAAQALACPDSGALQGVGEDNKPICRAVIQAFAESAVTWVSVLNLTGISDANVFFPYGGKCVLDFAKGKEVERFVNGSVHTYEYVTSHPTAGSACPSGTLYSR